MANRDLIGRAVGDYVLREPIGQGGGGVIYRSRQATLNRDLVVKVLRERPGEGRDARERFLREAQLASKLRHHYATHIYAFGVEPDGVRWIAMELVRGVTFDVWLREHGPMPLEQFVPLFERITEVVHAAHQLGIVHRDLKPSNIMVVEDPAGQLAPKLLDFGIAKASSDALSEPDRWPDSSLGENAAAAEPAATEYVTRTDPAMRGVGFTPPGAAYGSAPYMSPEQQWDSSTVGPAADIFSLGVVAYQALYGHLPPPPAPRPRGDADTPSVLDRIFARALARVPADRQATAIALAAEFRAALQASEREQLRTSARQWEVGERAPGLLWGRDMLARFEGWTRRVSWRALDASELAFIAHSQRRARRTIWGRRLLIGLAATVVLGALGGLQLYTTLRARIAQDHVDAAEQLVTQLEVEQGRQALRDNVAEAKVHLANAYRRGDHSDGTTFMLARALQSDRAQLARLPSRGGRVWSARFSPAGDTIVTTDDQSAQLWDGKTYQLRFALPHLDAVYDAMFSGDGKTLYTACGDGTIGVWDVATGAPRSRLRTAGASPRYYRLALSPDERMVAAIDVNGAIATVWDTQSGAQIDSIAIAAAHSPDIAFTSNGRRLVITGGADTVIFDSKTWQIERTLPKSVGFAIAPKAPRLATGDRDGNVVVWDVSTGVELQHFAGAGDPITRIAFSEDGKYLAAAAETSIQIWDADVGKRQARLATSHGTATSLEFSPSSAVVTAILEDGAVMLVDVSTGLVRSTFQSVDGSLRAAHFSADSGRVITADRGGVALVWSAGESYLRWAARPTGGSCPYDIPTDQRFVSLACSNNPTQIWDVAQGRLVATLPAIVDLHDDWISVLSAVSATGHHAAIARGHDVEVYELPGARVIRTVHHTADVNVVAFASDADDLVSADMEGRLVLTRDGEDSIALPRTSAGVDAIAILHDKIVAASADRQISIYDRTSDELITRRATPSRVGKLRFSSDGTRMVAMPNRSKSPTAPELWDLTILQPIAPLPGPRGKLISAWFANQTHELLTTSVDRPVERWDVDTGKLLQTYRGGPSMFEDATTTSDGKIVIALAFNGDLRFWESATGRPLWVMPALRSPPLALRQYRGDLITVERNGEMFGWHIPDADSAIQQSLDAAVSCRNEIQSSGPETCHPP